jgi:GNAT superfamily N-acetyltransferase
VTRPVELRPIDLADDATLAAAYDVECAATSYARPGWVPLGRDARIATWRADDGWTRLLVGAFAADVLVGLGTTQVALDTPGTAWVAASVVPEHHRRGIGTRLVAAAEAQSPVSVTRWVGSLYAAGAAGLEAVSRGFAGPLGYAPASSETVVELDLASEVHAEPVAPGYTVATYVNGAPPELRAEVGVIKGLVDAEAPNGELGWQPTPVSIEEYAAELALWQEQGRTAVESVALDGTGRVVAWTCVVASPDPRRPAQVEGTLVLAEHRGHGLGRAVKVASLAAVRTHTVAERVRTSSDDQNVWMRAINRDLGFRPVEVELILQKSGP